MNRKSKNNNEYEKENSASDNSVNNSDHSEVALEDLVNDLADADAASVEVSILLSHKECLYLKVSTGNMQEGREILEQVDVVSHDGQEFDLDYDVTGYGPSGEFGSYLAVYQSGDGLNYESISVDAGLQKFENSLPRF